MEEVVVEPVLDSGYPLRFLGREFERFTLGVAAAIASIRCANCGMVTEIARGVRPGDTVEFSTAALTAHRCDSGG